MMLKSKPKRTHRVLTLRVPDVIPTGESRCQGKTDAIIIAVVRFIGNFHRPAFK